MREKIIMEVPPDFDWRIYLELNEDITKYPHYTTQSGAISHWKLYGSKEGRPYKKNQVRRISSESTPIPTPEPEIIVETKNNVVEKLNNSKKLLTIVVPNKMGQTPHLTINSLYKQTFNNFDIIVVNDNDGNANAARNRGLSHVETPYVLFSDNDIEWEPDAIESMLVCLEENKNVSFAYGHWELKNKIKSNKEWNVDDLYKNNYISMMSVVRTAHHPGFDNEIKRFQDWDVWLTMAKENRIGKYIGKKIFTTPFREDGITENSIGAKEAISVIKEKHFRTENLNDVKEISINEYFDHVYCLNLDRRIEKWLFIKKKLDKLNIKAYRFSAVDGNDLSEDVISKHPKLSRGAIGCMLSYYEIIKDAKKNGYKRILVFEDDAIFHKEFNNNFSKIQNIDDWKILHLGASQHGGWSDIEHIKDFYYSKGTQGTFTIGFDESVYDEILETENIIDVPIDAKLCELQKKYYKKCITFFPNLTIADVSSSDIRGKRDINVHSKNMKWDLSLYDISESSLKILLCADIPGWAFDNIADGIIKYNPYPFMKYTKIYIRGNDYIKKEFKYDDWDYVLVFFEGDKHVPLDKNKLISGCYSAIWLESTTLTKDYLSERFTNCRGTVFVNEDIKNAILPYCPDICHTIINDAADETKFYKTDVEKFDEFTALYVGNTNREIKRFKDIKRICEKAKVKLEVAKDIPHDELYKLYNKVHLTINYSVSEGGPQTFFESSLCGVPMLINSDISMSKKIPCFSASTESDMINKLIYLKKNPDKCLEVGEEARKVVLQNYTYKHAGEKFSNFFLDLAKTDNLFNNEVTAFVISSGENPNFEDCLTALNNQTMKCKIDVIKDYSPSSRAFQEMINRCNTKYYIQVDEDMILFPTAIEKMYESISNSKNTHVMFAHGLHDVHLNFDIIGIKIYNHDVYKNYPYDTDASSNKIPTIEQLERIEKDGYTTHMDIKSVVGYHSPKWTTELIYERYFDLMEKYKLYGYTWLRDLPKKLDKMYSDNPTDINYFAMMGAKTSLESKTLRNRQKDYTIKDVNYLKIKEQYNKKNKNSGLWENIKSFM